MQIMGKLGKLAWKKNQTNLVNMMYELSVRLGTCLQYALITPPVVAEDLSILKSN